jgi:very-short-patch-repair endonuclease
VCRETRNNHRQLDTPPGSLPRVDATVARRAALQYGVLTRAQLLAAGLDEATIEYRLRTGRLHRVHRGVYAVGYVSSSPLTRAMAAVLACGCDAVLSHRSAAALWDIDPSWRGAVEVTSPSGRQHRGVVVHRSRTLTSLDVTKHAGIPVTTVARTLIDLADVLDDPALARAVNEAQVRGLRLEKLGMLLARSPGRRAAARLRDVVGRAETPTRSVLEDRFVEFVERYELPRPEINQRIAGYEVDMLWRSQRLVAELDGRRFHESPGSFERDREKDACLLACGYRVVRVTWRRLANQPAREAQRLRKLLGLDEAAPQ